MLEVGNCHFISNGHPKSTQFHFNRKAAILFHFFFLLVCFFKRSRNYFILQKLFLISICVTIAVIILIIILAVSLS